MSRGYYSGKAAASAEAVAVLAKEFSGLVRRDLADELPAIVKRNERYDRTYSENPPCATHDFCDANMVMLEAWTTVTGLERPPESEDEMATWSAAWEAARAAKFSL